MSLYEEATSEYLKNCNCMKYTALGKSLVTLVINITLCFGAIFAT